MARKRPEDAKPDAWMPLYLADFIADTAHLTTEQVGAYTLLLAAAWRRGGFLPDDGEQLQALTRLQDAAWARSWAVLRAFWTATGDGHLTQKRLAAEYHGAVERYGKRLASSAAAVAAREAKRDAERTTDGEPNGGPNGTPNGEPNGQHNNNHNNNHHSSSKNKKPLARQAARFPEFWDAYPKASRKGKADALKKWQARNLDAIADQILADVKARAAKDRQWLEGYIPHASTYVNGAGWEDAIDESPPKVATDKNGRPEIVPNPQGTSPAVKETPATKLAGAVSFVNQQLDLDIMTQQEAAVYLKPFQEAARAARNSD